MVIIFAVPLNCGVREKRASRARADMGKRVRNNLVFPLMATIVEVLQNCQCCHRLKCDYVRVIQWGRLGLTKDCSNSSDVLSSSMHAGSQIQLLNNIKKTSRPPTGDSLTNATPGPSLFLFFFFKKNVNDGWKLKSHNE